MTTSMRCALRASRCSPAKQARRLAIFSPAKAQVQATTPPAAAHIPTSAPGEFASQQHVTGPKHGLPLTYFDATGSQWMGSGNEQPLDPNKAKLGKSMFLWGVLLPIQS